jgi:hypothetical protein
VSSLVPFAYSHSTLSHLFPCFPEMPCLGRRGQVRSAPACGSWLMVEACAACRGHGSRAGDLRPTHPASTVVVVVAVRTTVGIQTRIAPGPAVGAAVESDGAQRHLAADCEPPGPADGREVLVRRLANDCRAGEQHRRLVAAARVSEPVGLAGRRSSNTASWSVGSRQNTNGLRSRAMQPAYRVDPRAGDHGTDRRRQVQRDTPRCSMRATPTGRDARPGPGHRRSPQ